VRQSELQRCLTAVAGQGNAQNVLIVHHSEHKYPAFLSGTRMRKLETACAEESDKS